MTLTVSADPPVERRSIVVPAVLTDIAYGLSLPLVLLLAWGKLVALRLASATDPAGAPGGLGNSG